MRLATWVMDALCVKLRDLIDSGGGLAYLEVYDGDLPSTIDGSYGTLLSRSQLGLPSILIPTNGIAQFNTITNDPMTQGYGVPKSFRIRTFADNTVMDGPVGVSSEVSVEDNLIQQSVVFTWQSGTITIGNRS
jgi:hypothetical protein